MKPPSSPAVSVVIPYYNLGDYIEETVASVLKQTYSNFEIIIVNDGTTDASSLHALNQIRLNYPCVRVIEEGNRGVAAARNCGIRKASGKYVVPLDADDTIEPTYLEKCVWFLETHPDTAYVYTGVRHFGDFQALCKDEFDFERLKTYNYITVTSMFQKRHFLDVGGYSEDSREGGYEDWDFWLSMGERGYFGALIPEELFNYRRRSGSRLSASKTQHDAIVSDLRRKHVALFSKSGGVDARGARHTVPHETPAESINTAFDYFMHHGYADRMKISNSTWFGNSRAINLLCIFPWLEVGGADLVNLNILKGIDRSRFNPFVISTLKSTHLWHDKFYALTPQIFILANFIPENRYMDFVLDFIESRRVDIVFISNSYAGFNMVPIMKRYFPQIKIVDLQHMEEPQWGWGYPRISSHFDAYLDKRITVSTFLRNLMIEKFNITPSKIVTIHNGIDCRHTFNPEQYHRGAFKREMGIPESILLICMIGRLCEQKQPLTFVNIAHELVNVHGRRDLFFAIIGDGELREATENAIKTHGLQDYVRITGYRHDVSAILRDTDLLVQPSRNEGLPIVALEAMAMRVPVIITKVGGLVEMINGTNGVLVEDDERQLVARFTTAICELLENPGRLREFGAKARDTILGKFDVDKMVSEYEKLFLELMNQ